MDTLFLALTVPDTIVATLTPLYSHYGSVVQERTPAAKLHVTLIWLGSAEVPGHLIKKLTEPLPQSFVPTVRLTHVGRGRQRQQLWAFGEATGPLMAIREQLLQRLTDMGWPLPKQERRHPFTPHITVASLYDQVSHIGVADHSFITSYAVREVVLYKSTPSLTPNEKKNTYIPLSTIPLV